MKEKRITLIGIGNVLRADDGVGVRVVEALQAAYEFPAHVEVVDGGTTGMALFPLIQETDHLIVVDAVNGDGPPGSLYRLGYDDFTLTIPKKISLHDLGFMECLTMAEINDHVPETVTVLGVKPMTTDIDSMELTPTVAATVDELTTMAVAELTALGVTPSRRTVPGPPSKL